MEHWRIPFEGGVAQVVVTDRAFGPVALDPSSATLDAMRTLVDRPWVQAEQVHGADVLDVEDLATSVAAADVLMTRRDDVALAVRSADCATLAIVSDDGTITAVHAGWRGLEADAIGAAARALRARGADRLRAVVGPHIGVECYEFGVIDLDRLTARFGAGAEGVTATGERALDVAAVVRRSLAENDVELVASSGECTACSPDSYWSHRARGECERQALVVWIERA